MEKSELLKILIDCYKVMEKWQCDDCNSSCWAYASYCEIRNARKAIEEETGKPVEEVLNEHHNN